MAQITRTSLLEQSDHWVLPLRGEVVVQCRYDNAFTLLVGELDPPFFIRISDSFTICSSEGSVSRFDPEVDPQGMGGTLRLLRGVITRSISYKDGRLEIGFEDGSVVRVTPSSGYEPWEISGPNGPLMVANTDGELVVWS
ncbi:MAG: DUF6188 family protein [Actinobacteria bacterium]|nr:DUF6188 family protein [Actinomycetota bacterium]